MLFRSPAPGAGVNLMRVDGGGKLAGGAQNTQRAAKRAARCQTGRSVELIDLPSQPVEAHRQPPALITREIGKGGDGPVLHLVIRPDEDGWPPPQSAGLSPEEGHRALPCSDRNSGSA